MSLSTLHTVFSKSNVETVWQLWSNVEHWPEWDNSIKKSSLKKSENLLDTECVLVIHGSSEPIITRVTEFVLNKSFTTQSENNLGTIIFYHEVIPSDQKQGVMITHRLNFEGKDERTKQIFEQNVWPGLTKDLVKAVEQLASIAESKKVKRKRNTTFLESNSSTEVNEIKKKKIEPMLSSSHTAFSKGNAEAIWALWSDVKNWPKWDFSLEQSDLKEGHNFEEGAECVLVTRGNPVPIDTRIIELTLNRSYITQNDGHLGTVTIYHDVTPVEGGVNITHRVNFDPKNGQTKLVFEQNIWPSIAKGLVGAVDCLARMAENKI